MMTEPRPSPGPSRRRLLLATDFCARSDRAMSRALALCEAWDADLIVVHVPDPSEAGTGRFILDEPASRAMAFAPAETASSPDEAAVRGKLARDFPELLAAKLVLGSGDRAEAVVRAAEEHDCDIIVIGAARRGMASEINLGKTTDRLLRRSERPVLVVKGRARHPYQNICVATDFSETSRQAAIVAAALFPDRPIEMFHAFSAPLSGVVFEAEENKAAFAAAASQEGEAFIDTLARTHASGPRPELTIADGRPGQLIAERPAETTPDLVVVGTHGRSALAEMLLGSVAKEIMSWAPCDVLAVRRSDS